MFEFMMDYGKIIEIINDMHERTKKLDETSFVSMIGMIVDDYCYNHYIKQNVVYEYLSAASASVNEELGAEGIQIG